MHGNHHERSRCSLVKTEPQQTEAHYLTIVCCEDVTADKCFAGSRQHTTTQSQKLLLRKSKQIEPTRTKLCQDKVPLTSRLPSPGNLSVQLHVPRTDTYPANVANGWYERHKYAKSLRRWKTKQVPSSFQKIEGLFQIIGAPRRRSEIPHWSDGVLEKLVPQGEVTRENLPDYTSRNTESHYSCHEVAPRESKSGKGSVLKANIDRHLSSSIIFIHRCYPCSVSSPPHRSHIFEEDPTNEVLVRSK